MTHASRRIHAMMRHGAFHAHLLHQRSHGSQLMLESLRGGVKPVWNSFTILHSRFIFRGFLQELLEMCDGVLLEGLEFAHILQQLTDVALDSDESLRVVRICLLVSYTPSFAGIIVAMSTEGPRTIS